MKHTQIIELFRNIKKRFVSFIAITLFVALGIGVFLGLGWAGRAMAVNADAVYSEQKMYDLQLLYPYGFDRDSLNRIAEIPGVDLLCGAYSAYQFFDWNGEKYYVRLGQITAEENIPYFVEGILPEAAGQIAVEATWARSNGLGIGDTVTFAHDDDGSSHCLRSILDLDRDALAASEKKACGMNYLTGDTYKVTALMESPEYIMNSQLCCGSASGTPIAVDCMMFLPECAFDADAFTGYPIVMIRSESLNGLATDSEEYDAAVSELRERVLELAGSIADEKTALVAEHAESILADLEEQLKDAERQLEDAEKQIADGRTELAKALEIIWASEDELDAAQAQIDNGWAEVREAQEQLDLARQELAQKQHLLDEAEAVLVQAQEEYDKVRQEYDDVCAAVERIRLLATLPEEDAAKELEALISDGTLSELKEYIDVSAVLYPDLAEAYKDFFEKAVSGYYGEHPEELAADVTVLSPLFDDPIADAENLLTEAQAELDKVMEQFYSIKAEFETYRQEIESKQEEINAGIAKLNASQQEVDYNRGKLAGAKKEVEEKKQALAEADEKLRQGKEEYAENTKRLEQSRTRYVDLYSEYNCGTLSRDQNSGYAGVLAVVDILLNLRFSLAGLFLLIGIFICFSALSRLVVDQVIQIGTKKALGLMQKEITLSFMVFSGIAAGLGILTGLLLGTFPIENYLIRSMVGSFNFHHIATYFSVRDAVLVCLLELVCVLLTTWLSCKRVLREQATQLLTGMPTTVGRQHFYEKTRLWQQLPLLTRTIVSNCINDRRRVFSTLVGVAGCTTLLVSVFTLTKNVSSGLDRQFTELQSFDMVVYTDGSDAAPGNLKAALAQQQTDSTVVCAQCGVISFPDDTSGTTFMYVVTEDNAEDFIRLSSRNAKHPQPITDGVWVGRSYENTYGSKPGDTFTFTDSIGVEQEMEIAGFFDCFLTNEVIIMNAATYEQVYGSPVQPNALLLNAGGRTRGELETTLRDVDGFASVFDLYSYCKRAFETLDTVAVAQKVLYVTMSVLMAVLVLLNLLVMFVEEKKKELIVLMINGYSVRDAKRYIYSDTIVLTVLGILIGTVLGTLMGILSVTSFESSIVYVSKDPDPVSCLIGVVGTALLTFIVSNIALGRIRRFRLTDLKE